jgi:hypothetical protein
MFSLKSWRDSNLGLLFLRRMRCPLRHAAAHFNSFLKQISAPGTCKARPQQGCLVTETLFHILRKRASWSETPPMLTRTM